MSSLTILFFGFVSELLCGRLRSFAFWGKGKQGNSKTKNVKLKVERACSLYQMYYITVCCLIPRQFIINKFKIIVLYVIYTNNYLCAVSTWNCGSREGGQYSST